MKPTHYAKTTGDIMGLYRALTVVLHKYEHSTPLDHEEALQELHRFQAWLGTTDAGHGLTAEPTAAFRAREALGVSVKESDGAIVIRVPRRASR